MFISTFSSIVPFNGNISYATHVVSAGITFSITTAAKVAGSQTTYRLQADGINAPNFAPFKMLSGSFNYDNRAGIINLITFSYDGNAYYYSIMQEKGQLPFFSTIPITFPTKSAGVGNSGNTYWGSGAPFADTIVSAQTIPANKDGRVIVYMDHTTLLGLNNSAAIQTFPTWEFYVWINGAGGNIYSGSTGTAIQSSYSSIGRTYFKIERLAGVVKAYYRIILGGPWILFRTFSGISTDALHITQGLTSGVSSDIISLEVGN